MKHRSVLLVAVAPLCAGLALSAGPSFGGTTSTRTTSYAFNASGYGTRLLGGQVLAGSKTTAFDAIGCTNQAGKDKSNDVASADIPGLGTATGIKTRVWTTSRHGVVASHATHSIANITLASSGVGSLSLDAVEAKARAFHSSSGFHATTVTKIGAITFTPPAGSPQTFPAPTPDQPVVVPGLATIYAGKSIDRHSGSDALAEAVALRIEVVPTSISVKVDHATARLGSGLSGGIFNGHSAATQVVTAGGDVAKSGPNPLSLMPCEGTGGVKRHKADASIDLGGQLIVKGAASTQRGTQGDGTARGFEKGEVAKLNLGAGSLVVDGIVGKVRVRRTPDGVTMSTKGTELGTITASGQPQTFPPTGVLEIPGVARLERKVVTRSRSGISVVALRVTLLDGSGAVIDLGEAALHVAPLPH
jgi:hypothetical protein